MVPMEIDKPSSGTNQDFEEGGRNTDRRSIKGMMSGVRARSTAWDKNLFSSVGA